MILAQLGLAFLAKRLDDRLSLAWLFVAACWLDMLWSVMLQIGVESIDLDPGALGAMPLQFTQYDLSHSLLMAVVWSAVLAFLYRLKSWRSTGAMIVFALSLSHWGIDFIFHRWDLPLIPGFQHKVGLGLWNALGATIFIEVGLFCIGLASYWSQHRSGPQKLKWSFWVASVVMIGVYLGDSISSPQSIVDAMNWSLIVWVIPLFGYWIDPPKPGTYQAIR